MGNVRALISPIPPGGERRRSARPQGNALVADRRRRHDTSTSSRPIDSSARRHGPHRQAMGGLRSRVIAGDAIAILATALLITPPHARDRVQETQPPVDVKLTSPGANVPADLARFAGAWTGAWDGDVCSTLVIEEVFGNGVARVVYSRGTSEALKIRQPNYWRATGRIADGVLRFKLPTVVRPDFEYRYRSDGDTLSGTASTAWPPQGQPAALWGRAKPCR